MKLFNDILMLLLKALNLILLTIVYVVWIGKKLLGKLFIPISIAVTVILIIVFVKYYLLGSI